MSLPKVSAVLVLSNKEYVSVGLDIVNSQTIGCSQTLLVTNNPVIEDYLRQFEDRDKNIVSRYIACDGAAIVDVAIKYCDGDFVWVCDPEGCTSPDFVERMTVIQRNIGADVILTNVIDPENDERDDITLYLGIGRIPFGTRTVESQWVKFFRKSLVCGDGSAVSQIRSNARSICYYERKMFSTSCVTPVLEEYGKVPSYRFQYSDLMGLDDLRSDAKIPITVGICAYNEQYVIERAVNSILSQKADSFAIDRIIIVSSGSTDDTNQIIARLSGEHDVIFPIYQEKKEGKNSAINELLRNSRTEIVVLCNADNILASEYSLDMLTRPFADEKTGVTGGHPMPLNNSDSVTDFTVRMMWTTHHCVSMLSPNIGELMAFRNKDLSLPTNTQGDECTIRYMLESKGYETKYIHQALLFNKGPTTVSDFIKQRTRVNVGERNMKRNTDFDHPTQSVGNLGRAFLATVRQIGFHPFGYIAAVSLELVARLNAKVYVKNNKGDMSNWDPVDSTKNY